MNVAVAVGGPIAPAWQRDCIEQLRVVPGVQVSTVWAGPPAPRLRGTEARFAGSALAPVEIAIDAGTVADADLVIDLAGGARFAGLPQDVWYFRVGEETSAALPFAREVASGRDTVEVHLLRAHRGETGRLRSGRFGVTPWYPSTLRVALREAASWPAILTGALVRGTPLVSEPDIAPARLPFSRLERMRLAASSLRRAAALFGELLFSVVEWNVGFAEGGPRALLAETPLSVRWLPRPQPFSFIADPFVVERDGVRALLVEEFDYARNRGEISALVLDDDDRVVRRSRVLALDTHLSYPYPVEAGSELYIVPENCAANEVVLYRCVQFPDRWERATAIFPQFDGVDTTLFANEGRWWAFCTRWKRGSTVSLHLFYAPAPTGPWTAHPLNPVVVDLSRARPAGAPFVVDGVLYRPGQDCSRSYGGALTIARIDELTPESYRETVVRRIDPTSFGRYRHGIHTVGFSRGRIVLDGKLVYRDVRKLGWAARRTLTKVRGRFERRSAV